MSADVPRRGLGRGLSALLGEVEREEPVDARAQRSPGVQTMPVGSIRPHPGQPRRHFDEERLDELAKSIAARGVIQPIVVRPHGDGFQIVAGERRWRAAQRARLHEVPVIVSHLDEAETLEVALIENIQREDLNAIEEAEAYARLMRDYGHTQEALGRIVQKSRSHVANLVRLLDLPATVRAMVADGRLTMGHARALVTSGDPEGHAERIVAKGLSVREAETLAKGARSAKPARTPVEHKGAGADIEALQRQLGDLLGLKVTISHGVSGGNVVLGYSSLDQLDMICQRLSGEPI